MKHSLSILLVEDDPLDAEMFITFLKRGDFPTCDITVAGSVSDALCKLRGTSAHLVVVDLNLPDSQGLDTFDMIHNATDLPVVIYTGSSDDALTHQAIAAGAQDYIVKGETDTHSLTRSLRFAVERSQRSQAERELKRQQREIRLLHELQEALLPHSPQLEVDNLIAAAMIFPAERASGDCCDLIPLEDSKLLCYVADVSGHGMQASQLMLSVRSTIRAIAKYTIDPEEILVAASDLLLADFSHGHFVTVIIVVVDPVAGTLTYATAGHDGYLFRANGQVENLASMYLPIGLKRVDNLSLKQKLGFTPGDRLLLVSDGIAETFNADQQMFGTQRLVSSVLDSHQREPAEIMRETIDRVNEFRGELRQADDISMVCVTYATQNDADIPRGAQSRGAQ